MRLLVTGGKEDLPDSIEQACSGCEELLELFPEGIEAEAASSMEEVLASCGSREAWDIAIADGASVAEIEEFQRRIPKARVIALDCAAVPKSAVTAKRPLLDGELASLTLLCAKEIVARREFDDIFNSSPSMMVLVDPDGKVQAWNRTAYTVTGVAEGAAKGRTIWEMMPFLASNKSSFDRALSTGELERLNRMMVDSGGVERYYDVSIYPLSKGRGATVRLDDVSGDVKKDDHLRQAQKMDSVGSLAAGLAHDFNNVIGGIEATISSMKFSMDSARDIDEMKGAVEGDFELVEESVQRGKDIIAQLMALSRRKEMPLSPVDLNEMVRNVLKICQNALPRCVGVESSLYDSGKAMVKAFPTQIEQSILNLCINASHAMTIMREEDAEQGGTLSVSVSPIEVGTNITSVIPEAAEGNYWLLSVSDTGIGMTREVMQKMFEPFFTTKDKGKGTGLGLAMVYNIVRQHKGFMDIFSEPGLGSTFLVFLPVLPES